MTWIARYQTIPFVDGGRDMAGCDCWGLVRLIYRDQLGIELPSYGEISAYEVDRKADAFLSGSGAPSGWVEPEDLREFDVAVMRAYGSREIGHCGVVTADGRIFHTEEKTGPCIVERSHYSIRSRIVFFRRNVHADATRAA